MRIEHFENKERYCQIVKDYLLNREAAHCWMLGFCSRKRSNALPLITISTQDNAVIGTAIISLPDMLVLSKFSSEEAIQLLVTDLISRNISLTGVIAPKPEAILFAKHWQSITGQSYRLDVAKRVYQLEMVNPINYANGYLRLATQIDRSLLIDWSKAIELEALNQQRTEQQYQDWYDRCMSENSLYVWQDDVLVSMAGFSSSTPNGIGINSVYTPLKYRKKGYATSCVSALSQILLNQGNKYCFLFADLANLTSNSIYQKIGYQPACDIDNYLFENQT